MSNQPFIMEQVNIPVLIVWDAITKNEQLKKWYFQIAGFDSRLKQVIFSIEE